MFQTNEVADSFINLFSNQFNAFKQDWQKLNESNQQNFKNEVKKGFYQLFKNSKYTR